MTKPSKKLSNQRPSIAKGRKSRHTRQKSPSPWPSPTPDSNYSISLEHQPDFLAQRSLVQETIEAAGHLCIFLPKFHCELNFIEYFWGAVKHYLCEHCNYTHAGLQENLPKALASVDISTIRKWGTEWSDGWKLTEVVKMLRRLSLLVKQFSSHRYDSHRWVPETVASRLD